MLDQGSQDSQGHSSTSDSGAGQEGQEGQTGKSLANASEGGDVDFRALFENQREEFSQELGKRDAELGKTKSTIDKLRQALMDGDGEGAKDADPIDSEISRTEAEMDQIIAAAMEAEKRGRPIPLTANTAIKSLQFKIQALKDKQETQKELAALKAQVQQLTNPQVQIERQAAASMDSLLQNSLQTIFGPNEDTGHLFEAISKDIVAEIKDLKANDPKLWAQISRDQKAQVKMVNHFVKKNIPPRARQIMEEDHIRRTPLTEGELYNAFQEAREALATEKNPRKIAVLQEALSKTRQELLERRLSKHMGGGSSATRARMSELF